MDLAQYDLKAACEKPRRMNVKNPINNKVMTDDNKKRFYIECLGIESESFNKHKFDYNRTIEKLKLDGSELTYEKEQELKQAKAVFFSELIVNWYLVVDGEAVEFSKSKAVELFNRFDWLVDQLNVFIGEIENFTKA